jgi:hypothetical protein
MPIAEDKTIQITLPWMLIATADAYGAGNYVERTHALLWIERVLGQEAVIHADTQVQNWWRAEYLLALRSILEGASCAICSSASRPR